jgi:pimeloyl-ACP methyl ester carboxylesterase
MTVFERHPCGRAMLSVVGILAGVISAHAADGKPALEIVKQGGYSYGGKVIGDPARSSLHCNHGYVEYQIPKDPRKIPILMWHSASTLTWEQTFDGREGFQSKFLRRGYPVYVIDGPWHGRADWGCEEYAYKPEIGRDQTSVNSWRLGKWTPPEKPKYYPGVQFPTESEEAWDQLFRGRYLEFEPNVQLDTDETAKLIDKLGPTTVFTHSGSGIRGFVIRLKSEKVAGVVAFEPVNFVWPEGDVPPTAAPADVTVPLKTFQELTKVPLLIMYGDNLNEVPLWANAFARAKTFIDKVNKHRSQEVSNIRAEVIHLPERGIRGNTHFPMADMNSDEIESIVATYLTDNGLGEK